MTHDATLDPTLRSWVATANRPDADFPIQNLPFGCFFPAEGQAARCGVAIGDRILDLRAARDAGLLDGLRTDVLEALDGESLTPLFATGRAGITARDWEFYMIFNMFRLAAIMQGIMARALSGTAASSEAIEMGRRARPLAELAWRQVERLQT